MDEAFRKILFQLNDPRVKAKLNPYRIKLKFHPLGIWFKGWQHKANCLSLKELGRRITKRD